jgi:hypothetical protein
VVFAFFYVLYGCLLYVIGPLVLPLLPITGLGQMGKSYATNLMVWNAWGILYATFGSLITAIQFNRVEQVMNQGFVAGFFAGGADSVVLGLVSVFYGLALGLIPFIARRLISGDAGSSAYALVRAGAAAAGNLRALAAGWEAGSGFNSGIGGSAAAPTGGAPMSAGPALSASISSSMPPPTPSFAEGIRSGLRSAMGEAAPVPSPAPSGDSPATGSPSSGSHSSRTPGVQAHFHASGVTQTIAFHAARFAATAAGNG